MKKGKIIAFWVGVAVVGALLTSTNPLWWLAGVAFGKILLRLALTITLAIVLYVMFYALIVAGIFWILIN